MLIDDIDRKASIYEAANKLPDIISTNTFSLHRYKNVMLPLDGLVARDQAEHQPDDFYPDIIESCRFAGDLFLVPYFFNVSLLYYNIDMFAAAGVALPNNDWTWEDYGGACAGIDSVLPRAGRGQIRHDDRRRMVGGVALPCASGRRPVHRRRLAPQPDGFSAGD